MKIQLKSKKIISALTLASLAFLFTHMRCSEKETAVRAVVPVDEAVSGEALEEPGINPPLILGCTNPNASNYDSSAQSMSECEFLCPDGVTVTKSDPYATNTSACVDNPAPNVPPRFVIPEPQNVKEGEELTVVFQAFDPDGDTLSFTAVSLPEGAILDGNQLKWTPTYSQGQLNKSNLPAKEYTAEVKVSDGEDIAEAEFKIYVDNVNRDPAFASIDNQQVDEGNTLNFTIGATDVDLPDDQLSIICESAATCSKVQFTPNNSNQSASISYTPGYDESGSFDLDFKVTDYKGKTDSETITITIGNSPRPPQLVYEKDSWTMNEYELITIPISGLDPDNDNVKITVVSADDNNYNITGDNDFHTPDMSSRSFSWQPSYTTANNRQPTVYKFKFRIEEQTSYQLFEEKEISITVSDSNRPPVLALIGDRTVGYNEILNFNISATDPDGDPISYSAQDNHANTSLLNSGQATFDATKAELVFDPITEHFGNEYHLKFIATDSYGASDNEEIEVTVGDPPANMNETIALSSSTTYTNDYDTVHLVLTIDGSGSMDPAQARIFDALTNTGMQNLFSNVNLKVSLLSMLDDDFYSNTSWGFRQRFSNYPSSAYFYGFRGKDPLAVYTLDSDATAAERQQFFNDLKTNMGIKYSTNSSLTDEAPICSGLMMASYDDQYLKSSSPISASSFSIENNEAMIMLSLVGEAMAESKYTCLKSRKRGTQTTTSTSNDRYRYHKDYARVSLQGINNNEDTNLLTHSLPVNTLSEWQSYSQYIPSGHFSYNIPSTKKDCSQIPNGNFKNLIESKANSMGLTVKGNSNYNPATTCYVSRWYYNKYKEFPSAGNTGCTNGINGQSFRDYIISTYSDQHELNTDSYCAFLPGTTNTYTTGHTYQHFTQNNGSSSSLEGALADKLYNRFSSDLDRISYIGIHRKDNSVTCQANEATSYSAVNSLETLKTKLTTVGISAKTVNICKNSYVEDIQGSVQQTIENVLNKTYDLNIPSGYQVGTVTIQYANQSYNTVLATSDYEILEEDDGSGSMIDKIKILDFQIPQGADDPGPASIYISYSPI
ncbi:Ig-like domain-containing protein [Bacteriovoracaceae bacterium]|nr:Ig-like domain-containing protein [Bacteriovoracaceae bacterium]